MRDLQAFTDADAGTLADVRNRLEFARTVRQRTLYDDTVREKWKEAIEQISDVDECPAYDGLELEAREGLMPIGRDPDSGLWEFAHLQSGRPAERGADGKLGIDDATGLVFVLIPGETFRMGAVLPVGDRAAGSPNVDPHATRIEYPDHEIRLAPFFMSKYEMTQGQWQRFTSKNPSFYSAGRTFGGQTFTLHNPVENVTWEACGETLRRLGLMLPTEAQWEYATRGGTTTVWWTGNDVKSLENAANIADSYYKSHGAKDTDLHSPEIDDGHFAHAPIGAYRANGFGLHDVVGNVWEWCRDGFDSYARPVRAGDGLREAPDAPGHVYRGGGFNLPARYTRSALRFNGESGFSHVSVGVRPAMALREQISSL